jgi:hypothetical protein
MGKPWRKAIPAATTGEGSSDMTPGSITSGQSASQKAVFSDEGFGPYEGPAKAGPVTPKTSKPEGESGRAKEGGGSGKGGKSRLFGLYSTDDDKGSSGSGRKGYDFEPDGGSGAAGLVGTGSTKINPRARSPLYDKD